MKVKPNPLLGTLAKPRQGFDQILEHSACKFSSKMTKAALNNPYITRPNITKLIKPLQELLLSFGLTKDQKLLAKIKRVQQASKDLQGGMDTSALENLYNR